MLSLVLAFILGLACGVMILAFIHRSKNHVEPLKNTSYGYLNLDKKKLYTIRDDMDSSWIMTRFNSAGAHCVPRKWARTTLYGDYSWSPHDEEWFDWISFQKKFPEYAHYGPQIEPEDDSSVRELLTPEELAMLTDYRKAREELNEVFKA